MSRLSDENAPQDNRPRDMQALLEAPRPETLGAAQKLEPECQMPKPALLTTGPMMSLIEEGIDKAFVVHRLQEASDREALLKKVGPDIRAICTGSHTGVKTDAAMMAHCPSLKIIGNFGVGYDSVDVAAAAKRGIVITNTPDVLTEEVADTALGLLLVHGARVLPGREMAARRPLGQGGRLPADRRFAARPLDRHRRLRPHRQGHRAAHRGLRPAGQLFRRASRSRVCANRYYGDLVAMARDVDTLIAILPGGPATAEARSTRRCWTRWARAASSSTWRAARWSTRRR